MDDRTVVCLCFNQSKLNLKDTCAPYITNLGTAPSHNHTLCQADLAQRGSEISTIGQMHVRELEEKVSGRKVLLQLTHTSSLAFDQHTHMTAMA